MHHHIPYLIVVAQPSADTLEWITAISTSLAAIGTVIAAIIAMYAARQSAESALDSKRSSQASLMPIIEPCSISLGSEPRSDLYYIEINFKNVGRGLAQNIRIDMPCLSFSQTLTKSINPDGGIEWTRSQPNGDDAKRWGTLRGKEIEMSISYTDIFGNEILTKSTILLDVNSFHLEDFHWIVEYVK